MNTAKRKLKTVAAITGLVLLIPFVAMYFTPEVNWGVMDFIVAGVLLSGFGSVFVLISPKVQPKRRPVIAATLTIVLICVWLELAVGLFIF